MSPTQRVWRSSEQEVFVSLEKTEVVMAELRAALPELTDQLRARWPVSHIEIKNRLPRAKNPIDSRVLHYAHLPTAEIGLAIVFVEEVLRNAGKKIGEAVGEEISAYVRAWVRDVMRRVVRKHGATGTTAVGRECECGCGKFPKKPDSRFLPGHDLKKAYKDTEHSRSKTRRLKPGS